MNNDLISRSALKKVISEYIDEYSDLDNEGNHCEKWCAMKEAEMAIDNAPTVEFPEQITIKCDTEEDKQKLLSALRTAKLKVLVEEDIPHGEWLEDSGNIACSHCHTIWLYRKTDYCPNCGADMRGDANESD